MNPGITEESTTRDNLFGGNFPIQPKAITIPSGQGVRPRLTVIQADGTAADAAANAYALLAEDIDATAAAVDTTCYLTGEVLESEVTYNGTKGNVPADVKAALETRNLYLVDSIAE